jgi:oligoendopeptidase F
VLAETASTLGEYLLFLDALSDADDERAIALLCEKLDDALLCIVNQLRITRFEVEAHALLAESAPASKLDALWGRLAQEDFPDIAFPDTNPLWRSIPHIHHTPFYCYSYAFGLLLVCALVRRRTEPGFAQRVKAILAAGGDAMPIELLKTHGLDVTTDAVWEDGFATIAELVAELEARVAKQA